MIFITPFKFNENKKLHAVKIILGTIAGISFIFGFFYFPFLYVFNDLDDLCSNKIIYEIYSPNTNKEKKLVYFTRDCGTLTSTKYELSVINYDDDLSGKSGNVFWSDYPFAVKWINSNTIEILSKNNNIIKKKQFVDGIHIKYQ